MHLHIYFCVHVSWGPPSMVSIIQILNFSGNLCIYAYISITACIYFYVHVSWGPPDMVSIIQISIFRRCLCIYTYVL